MSICQVENLDEDYFGRMASLVNSSKQTGMATCWRQKCTIGFQKLNTPYVIKAIYYSCVASHIWKCISPFLVSVMCLFMQTERKYVNSFENARRKCENGTSNMALSCKCLQILLWSLCGQHIPRTESGVGGRKGTVKLFMNCILSFPAEVH